MSTSKSHIGSSDKVRIGMVSLGCPKTLVDSETILGKLDSKAYEIVPNIDDCDVALLNTCTFIQPAQQESVNHILELIELKKAKKIQSIIVMGCLVQRFEKELQAELKEVDAFIGSGEYAKIPEIVGKVEKGRRVYSVGNAGYLATAKENRIALTPMHSRYLKISEGCDHVCTFCTIPTFRGKHRSRTIKDVVSESRKLVAAGAKEIILTGQDTTYFGRDHGGEYLLPDLLKALEEESGAEWIRLLYAYPSCITPELMKTIGRSKTICHYLDMPLQHASDRMLAAMKRGITKRRTIELIKQFRAEVPDLAIRTTFIVGFPGETQQDFEELLEFMADTRFERLGVFAYSQEEGSAAAALPDQISEKIKKKRLDEAMRVQQRVSVENNKRFIGKKLKVLVEEKSAEKKDLWIARSEMDAPDVDCSVLIHSTKPLNIGSFANVTIIATEAYDLVAKY